MLVDLWLKALRAKYGLVVTTDNRMLLRQHLYRARMEANNPSLESIAMVLPEKADEIWLVHRDADGIGANHKGNVEPLYP